MTFKRLILIEIEKLVRSSVFLVAPIVLVFFLALMLFGFEVYAAKHGRAPQQEAAKSGKEVVSIEGQNTGSAIVTAYATLYEMVNNVVVLVISPFTSAEKGGKKVDKLPIAKPGTIKDFDYLKTLYKNMTDPKPLPEPTDKCKCADGDNEGKLGFNSFFLGTAYAFNPKPPPSLMPHDSFVDRLQKRLVWLMEPIELKKMVIDRSRFNGLRYTYFSLYFAFVFLFPLITVSVVAEMFTSEFSHGTIRNCLLCSVKRTRFLQAKLLVFAGYLFLLILFFVLITLFVGIEFSGYGNLVLDSGLLGESENNGLILADGAIMLFLLAVPVATVSLFPLAAFAILLSHIKPEPATVIGITSIVYLILFTLGGLPLFEDIRFLFFTTYMDVWMLFFKLIFSTSAFVYKLSALILMTLGMIIPANYLFVKKDIYV